MCIARPLMVVKVDGERAVVDDGSGGRLECGTFLAGEVKEGDFLLVHGDLAVHKLTPEEAARIIALVEELDHAR